MTTAEKLDQALQFLANSRRELAEGKVVVLEGFQNDVQSLCAELGNMPVGEMSQFAPKLEELSSSLAILEKELREQQMSVQQEIFSLNRKQNALKSYQQVNHSHKNPEEEN